MHILLCDFICMCLCVCAYMCLYMCNNVKIITIARLKQVHYYNLLQSHNRFLQFSTICKVNIITISYFQIIQLL